MTVIDPDHIPEFPHTQGEVPFYREKGQAHPRAVKGLFRDLKWWAMALTLAWWHLAPFLRWDRGPGAPDQAILVDMAGRRAYFFDIEIWPQEVYYLTGILAFAAITLFLMSALAGRVWCGFLCWQTVYTDLFQNVERWVLGDRTSRLRHGREAMSAGKAIKQGVVYATWFVISAACGIGFVLWFGDAFEMLRDIFTGQAGGATYLIILVIGGFCFLLAGFARERVCVYMCPYSRFQAAMFDEHSLIVSYEGWRGEPRAPAPKSGDFSGRGHCVDCKMCIASCPTGIDIRFGNQLACIGCGLCIDACDKVMERFGLPKGLISYDSAANLEARTKGAAEPGFRLLRARTLVYGAVLAIIGAVMLTALLNRATTEVNVLHERAPLFVQLSDGTVRNGYTYKILNMVREDRSYTLTLEGLPGATLEMVGGPAGVTAIDLPVEGDQVGTFRLFVNSPESALKSRSTDVTFVLTEKGGHGNLLRNHSLFAGPGN
ncbi:cytochrome c oxidase accessory protein CcoG [Magnetospirillum sp. UT-4]|uniref:cytochrome c oxidase accessory protein CcoG n=1 Tax=Magnetospirillum sp. UT-4 TaxID=2681467 RepID=UPI00137C6FB5|nr:cytochrome c oxidase accessory protein CcoG [Magnetospirillum sp. UT-4]CAA7626451.1 Nitrogen fixation protein FixG [Magnetospirillum sp. UT-4]